MKLLFQIKLQASYRLQPAVSGNAPDFVKEVTAKIIAGEGDLLPVSKMPVDGTFPLTTTKMGKEKYCLRSSGLGYGNLYSM